MIAALFLLFQSAIAADGYTIGAGDVVEITVHGANFEVSHFPVSETGDISFPYVGRIKLAGLSIFEAEAHMTTVLKDGYLVRPEVTVQVDKHSSHIVEVIGSVKSPGSIPLTRKTSIRQLITQAGGASPGSIIILSRDDQVFEIDPALLDGEEGTFEVLGGDLVSVVPGQKVYVSGEVKKKGATNFREGMTVSQLLLESGGPTNYARLRGAYIVRNRQKIRVNLKRILTGKDADLELRPGDRLIVPISAF